jgi:hypothetical protein
MPLPSKPGCVQHRSRHQTSKSARAGLGFQYQGHCVMSPTHVSEGSDCVTAWMSSNTRSSSIHRASEQLHADPFKSPSRKAERSRVKARSNAKPSATPGKTRVEAQHVVVHGGEEAEHLLTAFCAETSVRLGKVLFYVLQYSTVHLVVFTILLCRSVGSVGTQVPTRG